MTEDQAKTKWCPQARITTGDGSSGNRHILSIDGMNGADRCFASACMAWRAGVPRVGSPGDGGPVIAGTGYCGLAGQPS